MEQLADRLNLFSESQTLKVAKLSRELKAQGKDIISLSLGEPDFNTPDFIKEAGQGQSGKECCDEENFH